MGLLSRALSRSRSFRLPIKRDARLTVSPVGEEADDIFQALTSPREVSWWWKDQGRNITLDSGDISRREAHEAFDAAAAETVRYAKGHFPRNYQWTASGGRGRRYSRDLASRLASSGYRQLDTFPGTFEITPTPTAYALFAADKLSPLLTYGALAGTAAASFR